MTPAGADRGDAGSPRAVERDAAGRSSCAPDDATDGAQELAAPVRGRRRSGRRVTTQPAPGSDPTPAPVDRRVDSTANDDRLRADKPPHWG